MAEFRTALNLDPQNEFAQQRMLDALGPVPVRHGRVRRKSSASADKLIATPSKSAMTSTTAAIRADCSPPSPPSYGLTVVFDDSFPSRRVRFDLETADFATAMQAASAATKSFAVPIEDKVLFAAADNPENHRLFDRMGMRSFYIPGASTPQELTELMNSLRTLFEFKFASLNAAAEHHHDARAASRARGGN